MLVVEIMVGFLKSMKIDLDTKIYLSISDKKSTNGVYFYNKLFIKQEINSIYYPSKINNIKNCK